MPATDCRFGGTLFSCVVECIIRLTFGDAQGLRKRKQTRRDIFLYEMDQIVPWKALLA